MAKSKKYAILFDKEINGVYPKIKQRFLNTVPESVKLLYEYYLKRAYKYETKSNKDIYEFGWDELDSLIKTYSNRSLSVVNGVVSCLREYLRFCISEGFVPDQINYLNSIGGEEDMKKYLDVRAFENRCVSRDRIIEIEKDLVNSRDIAIIELLFIGAMPKEIANLKISDCDFENKSITLTEDNDNKRILDNLSDYTIDVIKHAIEESSYVALNGVIADENIIDENTTSKERKSISLSKTEYVVRNIRTSGQVTNQVIATLIGKMKEWVHEPYLTSGNVRFSGEVYFAKQLLKEKGELQKEDYLFIQERFKIKNNNEFKWTTTKYNLKNYL